MSGPAVDIGRVAVVGGGIAGLAAAYRLAQRGARVTLYEASGELGGLGTAFDYGRTTVERFYHCMLPSDRSLLGLIGELGLGEEVYWKPTSFGYLARRQLFALNGARDLLHFGPLPMADRLRVGLTGLWGQLRGADGLDDMSCAEWLSRLSGPRAYAAFWRPLLQAKFGDRHDQVPALWFWTRFNREKGQGPEVKGYLPGGYRRIAQTLARRIVDLGGEIRLDTAVRRLDLDATGAPLVITAGRAPERFDRLVHAAPLGLLWPLAADGRMGEALGRLDRDIDMQGVVNVVLVLRRSLSPHYWVATVDDALPFQGIVETTRLIDRTALDGHHLVYLTRYTHRDSEAYADSDERVAARSVEALSAAMPDFERGDIVDRFVFRSPFVEPIYTLGYERRKPPLSWLAGRVYLATTAQVYPGVTSWNGSVGLVDRMIGCIEDEAGAAPTLPAGGASPLRAAA